MQSAIATAAFLRLLFERDAPVRFRVLRCDTPTVLPLETHSRNRCSSSFSPLQTKQSAILLVSIDLLCHCLVKNFTFEGTSIIILYHDLTYFTHTDGRVPHQSSLKGSLRKNHFELSYIEWPHNSGKKKGVRRELVCQYVHIIGCVSLHLPANAKRRPPPPRRR